MKAKWSEAPHFQNVVRTPWPSKCGVSDPLAFKMWGLASLSLQNVWIQAPWLPKWGPPWLSKIWPAPGAWGTPGRGSFNFLGGGGATAPRKAPSLLHNYIPANWHMPMSPRSPADGWPGGQQGAVFLQPLPHPPPGNKTDSSRWPWLLPGELLPTSGCPTRGGEGFAEYSKHSCVFSGCISEVWLAREPWKAFYQGVGQSHSQGLSSAPAPSPPPHHHPR